MVRWQLDGPRLVLELHHLPRLALQRQVTLSRITAHSERETNGLFNDARNTFYLRLYGVRHMVKDHSDSEKGERERNVFI